MFPIENLNHSKKLDIYDRAWQKGSTLAAQTHGRVTVNKLHLCGPLYYIEMIKAVALH